MKNNMTGDKINYSLRVQKNVERKIFIDIIRSLNYFNPVEKYRYIGFGSCYYKDFLLLHEKYNIRTGISVEKDNIVFGKNEEKKSCYLRLISKWFTTNKEHLNEWLCQETNNNRLLITPDDIDLISIEIAEYISKSFFDMISNYEEQENIKYKSNEIFNYTYNTEEIKQDVSKSLINSIKDTIILYQKDSTSDTKYVFNQTAISSLEHELLFEINDFSELLSQSHINRYIYNKPYGYIRNIFKEYIDALDDIEWSKKQNSIIWMDYDIFLDNDQLNGLEKTIKLAQRGDLIIFSTSMGEIDEYRKESLDALRKENKNRIASEVLLKNCTTKEISKTIRNIVRETALNAISKKNDLISENENPYRILDVFDCTYADGMPMYTYAIIVYSELDDINSEYFPQKLLEKYSWYYNSEKPYDIYVPALTHKEICAINQLLPQNNIDEIIKMLPFIKKNNIRRYIDIWRYYPNFLEVDNYV